MDGLDFTDLFTAGLVLLTFIVAGLVAAIARCWTSWPVAIGIGVLAGAWSGFMSAGEILKNFDAPVEQMCPVLAFGLVTCAARFGMPWRWARRVGLLAAVAVMAVQAVLMADDLSALSAGRLTYPGHGSTLPQPRAVEWWVLAAPVAVLLTGFAVLARLGCRAWVCGRRAEPGGAPNRGGKE
jgi:hypothetical protein